MRRLSLLLLLAGWMLAQDQPLVRSVRFEHFKGVSTAEILDRLNQREVLSVEAPYHPEEMERAKVYIAQFLAEKGHPHARIVVAARPIHSHEVEVRITLVK